MGNEVFEKNVSKQNLEKAYLEFAKYLKIKKLEAGELQFTDRTNKILFLKVHGDSIRYCYSLKKFLIWNGTCWEFDNDGVVRQLVFDFAPRMYRAGLYMDDEEMQIEYEKNALRFESVPKMNYLYHYLQSAKEINIKASDLDLDYYLFNAEKKTVNLKTGETKEPEPNDLLTKKSIFVYDKAAKCPTWDMFLMQIFNNDLDLIHFVQKALGYTLSGDISEQCMFILFGSGANGKSTLLNVIQKLFGDYAVSTITDTFMKKNSEQTNDLARLKNARLVIASEAEENKPMSESLIKQITGGDKISARFLYGEYFDFTPTFKIFMATNHKPKISGGDNGIWRRIKLIPFTVSIPEEKRDKHLQEKLLEENAGILNWLLEGYRMWEKEGLKEPDAVREANAEYRFDMDVVQNFICECLNIDTTFKERVLNAELFDAYKKWCEKNNETALPQRKFTSKMKEKNHVQFPSNGNRWWKGISLKNEWKA